MWEKFHNSDQIRQLRMKTVALSFTNMTDLPLQWKSKSTHFLTNLKIWTTYPDKHDRLTLKNVIDLTLRMQTTYPYQHDRLTLENVIDLPLQTRSMLTHPSSIENICGLLYCSESLKSILVDGQTLKTKGKTNRNCTEITRKLHGKLQIT